MYTARYFCPPPFSVFVLYSGLAPVLKAWLMGDSVRNIQKKGPLTSRKALVTMEQKVGL